jgi:protein-S-isoprenylcysteine O-methyltransferase Ste14
LAVPLQAALYCWFALEVGLVVRDVVGRKVRIGGDRGTRLGVSLSLAVSIGGALAMRRLVPALDTPGPAAAFTVAGVVVIALGLAVRVWAVVTLGRSFSTYIQVDADQPVITRGPYRWVRHPSYSGLLLITSGFGLGVGNWLSLVVCIVVPLLGLVPRIAVEEAELVRGLGEPYRDYQRTTRRLVPGLW